MPPSNPPLPHQGDEPHLLREIVRTHQVLMAGASRGLGVSASRFTLMRLIAVSPEEIGVMELARQLGINAAAVTRQVHELEAEKLITRRTDPRDGRRSFLRLSAKGRKLFEQMHERTHRLEQALSKLVTPEEMAVAVKVLTTLRTFVESMPAKRSP